jgi:hypothetical protein
LKSVYPIVAALLLASCAEGGKKVDRPSDWEVKNERFLKSGDNAVVPEPPAYPKNENLAAFFVTSASDNRFFVDRSSVNVNDGIVRYTLVVRTAFGVDNISFEGINCKEREFRSYARGSGPGQWITRPTEWRKIEPQTHLAQNTLHWEYFCPNRVPIYTASEGVQALEKGGHPWSKKPDTVGGSGR